MMWLIAQVTDGPPTGLAGFFIGIGLAGGLTAVGWFAYRTCVKLIEMYDRKAVRRQADKEAMAKEDREEKKEYLAILARVAQIQSDASLMLSEHRTLMTAAMTTVAVNLDQLTAHVRALTQEVRGGGNNRTRRPSPPPPPVNPPEKELPR